MLSMSLEKTFHHFGVYVTEDVPGTEWIPVNDIFLNNPNNHPQRVEWIFHPEGSYEEGTVFEPHIAYTVNDLDAAIAGKDIVIPPQEMGGFCRAAFTYEDGIQVEYIQLYPGRSWFDDEVSGS
jgi:hypothetical protein